MGQPGSGDGERPRDVEVMVGQGGASIVEITLFPGESIDGDKALGTMYVRVRGELVKRYPACAGPPPGKGRLDRGGHTADPTEAGRYVLAAPVHYTTRTWPTSTIPWGAPLRTRGDGETEYSPDGGKSWRPVTGPDGVFSLAWIAFEERGRAADADAMNKQNAGKPGWKPVRAQPMTAAEKQAIHDSARRYLLDREGKPMTSWLANDFGPWAWNLQRRLGGGKLERSAMFVHTTPQNERETAAGAEVVLTNSHGCIHVRPRDRDEMMELGYLQAGVAFVVKPYGVSGP